MTDRFIKSTRNPRIRHLSRLKDSRYRRRHGHFIIEGRRELNRALDRGLPLEEVFFAREYLRNPASHQTLARASTAGLQVTRLSPDAFLKCSYRENPDGLLAAAPMWRRDLSEIPVNPQALVMVLESVEKPGNLGNLIRTADAAGVDGVIVTDPATDIFNPNVIRASQGSLFETRPVVCSNEQCLNWLQDREIVPYATSPRGTTNLWEAHFDRATAIILGSEQSGLSDFWVTNAAVGLSIPMRGLADSLNITSAAAIVLFEVLRQRREKV